MRDQASKLREMMSKKQDGQQDACVPVAVFSCVETGGAELSKQLAWQAYRRGGKKVLHINADTKRADVYRMIEKNEHGQESASSEGRLYSELEEAFDNVRWVHPESGENRAYAEAVRHLEKDKEVLFYYCGNAINAKAMNLMALASVAILFVGRDQWSMAKAWNVIKVQQKIHPHMTFQVIGVDIEEREMASVVEVLKEADSMSFEGRVRGIGVCENALSVGRKGRFAEMPDVQQVAEGKNKTLSARLQMME